jgi:hypothetical protein
MSVRQIQRMNFQSGGERFSFSRQVAPKSDEGGWGEGRDEGGRKNWKL